MTRDLERSIKKLKDTAKRLDALDLHGPDFALGNSIASSLRMQAQNLETRGMRNLTAAEGLIAKYAEASS